MNVCIPAHLSSGTGVTSALVFLHTQEKVVDTSAVPKSAWEWFHAEIVLQSGKYEVTEIKAFLIGRVPVDSLRPPPLLLAISWNCTEAFWVLFLSQVCL